MKKNVLLILVLIISSYCTVTQAQTSVPEITRIVVDEHGGVTLIWISNTVENDFDHSEVWYHQAYESEFKMIPASVSTYYLDYYYEYSIAQANSRKTDYYVKNVNANLIEFSSDMVSAIYLTSCFKNEKIELTWNIMHPAWNNTFYIYRKAGMDAAWEFVDSTKNTTYQDNPMAGFKNYSYIVYNKDKDDPTFSVSNATKPISYSEHKPTTPSIVTVEIDTAGRTFLEWDPSPTADVVSYIIYRNKASSGWDPIGQTSSPDTLFFLDIGTTLDDCEIQRTYAVAAVDACGETGTHYPDSSKSILILHQPEYATCDRGVNLVWEPYEEMTIDRYEILTSIDSGITYIKYADVPGDQSEYFYTDLKKGYYCFKVRAVHERGAGKKAQTATSCSFCVDVYYPQEPAYSFFRYVSVIDNRIHICFEVDTTASSPKYQIQRSETGLEGSYQVVETLLPGDTSIVYAVDASSNLNTQNISYHYLLYSLDSCERAFPAEMPAQTILLTATEDENHFALLEWNSYDSYLPGLDRYIINRYVNGEIDRTFLINTSSLSYTDTDLLLSDQTTSFSYRIAAISNLAYYTEVPDTAYSNIATLKRLKSDIWFPNAFTPTGQNKIFRPVYAGIDVDYYELTIFDRYGAAIYQTNEPGGGWDGKINGRVAASGGYGYMLKITQKNGDRIERRGSMVLIN